MTADEIARHVAELCAATCELDVEALFSAQRGRAGAADARHTAMYLLHCSCGFSMTDIAHHFGRNRTSVCYAIKRVEDRRDDPCFDAIVTAMEDQLPFEIKQAAETAAKEAV